MEERDVYPDVSMVCGQPEFVGGGTDVIANPIPQSSNLRLALVISNGTHGPLLGVSHQPLDHPSLERCRVGDAR
jgi:hypothetical protein